MIIISHNHSLLDYLKFKSTQYLVEKCKFLVYGFREITETEVKQFGRLSGQHLKGYQFMTYTIEPIKLLPWLLAEFMSLGGKLVRKKVSDLGKIAHQFQADVIFNCTGVWATQLTTGIVHKWHFFFKFENPIQV